MNFALLLAVFLLPTASGAAFQNEGTDWNSPPETFGHWKMVTPGEPPQEVYLLNLAGDEWRIPIVGAASHLNANQDWFRFIVIDGVPIDNCEALDVDELSPGTFAICEAPSWDDFGGMYTVEDTGSDEHDHIFRGYIGIDQDEYDLDPSTEAGRRISSIQHELLHVMGLDHSRGRMVGVAADGNPLFDGQTCVWSVRESGPNPSPPEQCPGSWDMSRLEQLYAHSHTE